MDLYLAQHGEAKTEAEDPHRGLTEKGIKDAEKVAGFLALSGITVNKIFHSNKKRAFETAKIFGRALNANISEADNLQPMDNPRAWIEKASKAEEDMMLVGHLPHLSRLVSLLIACDTERGVVDFKMGGVLCLRKKNGIWSVEWFVTPDIIKS